MRKGIILAGGLGSRLAPITFGTSKQLLPIFNKPMIYYPLTTLMQCDITEFLIITNPGEINQFQNLLGNGEDWGISITYQIQEKPNGIAEAFILGEKFIGSNSVALILGDNLFYGEEFLTKISEANLEKSATLFAYPVNSPERYGVVEFDKNLKITKIVEKPKSPKSKFAITGLYFYDNEVIEISKKLEPSKRGELEITDINNIYLKKNKLTVKLLERGTAWLDTGTFNSLHEAGSFIKTLENRQGLRIGYPEEVAWRKGLISKNQFQKLVEKVSKNEYGLYLNQLLQNT